MTPLAAAKQYLDRGWCPVPIPPHLNHPILKDWPQLRLTKAELPRYFDGKDQNVGVILGEPSGDLADVDLDSPEALLLADLFLPGSGSNSAVRANRARTGSTWPGSVYLAFSDPDPPPELSRAHSPCWSSCAGARAGIRRHRPGLDPSQRRGDRMGCGRRSGRGRP